MSLVDAKLLLTGGTGFFGRALLRHWSLRSECGAAVPRVTVLTRSPQQFAARHPEFRALPWLEFQQGDVLERGSLPEAGGYTHVLHAATDSTLGPTLTPLERYTQIVDGTKNLLNFAVACRARFLLTSSGGVYGPQPPDLTAIPEDFNGMPDPLVAANAYSVGKRAAEHLCALYRDRFGLETVVARCFAFVGRDLPRDAHFAVGNFIRDALGDGPITVRGDGSAVRSYLDQRDLAGWLLVLLERGAAGRAYNVGSDEAVTIGALAHLVRDALAPGKDVVVLGSASADATRHRYVPDIRRAREELGLSVSIALRDALVKAGASAPGHGSAAGLR